MAWNDRPHMFALKGTTGTTMAKLSAIRDAILSSGGSEGVIVPQDAKILGAWVGSQYLTKAQFVAASLLRVGYLSLRPITAGAAGSVLPGNNPNVVSLLDAPVGIRANEVLTVQALASAADTTRALVIVGGKIEPLPPGSSFWVRYSATTAAVADTWTWLDITLDSLPAGMYAVVGHEHWSANCVAARLVFPGQVARPGTVGLSGASGAAACRTHSMFYEGGLGVLGTFQAFAPPGVEVLSTSTDALHDGYLRLIKL